MPSTRMPFKNQDSICNCTVPFLFPTIEFHFKLYESIPNSRFNSQRQELLTPGFYFDHQEVIRTPGPPRSQLQSPNSQLPNKRVAFSTPGCHSQHQSLIPNSRADFLITRAPIPGQWSHNIKIRPRRQRRQRAPIRELASIQKTLLKGLSDHLRFAEKWPLNRPWLLGTCHARLLKIFINIP
jgi:hypothetical protein